MPESVPRREIGSTGPSSTSSNLLERARAKQPDAWDRLADLYGPTIYRWCRQTGLQAADAADILQEVFAAVATNIGEFRRDRPGDSFRGWLWRITRNKINDHFRRQERQPRAQGGTDFQEHLAQVPEHLPDSSTTGSPASAGSSLEHRAVELVRAGVEDRTWQAFWRIVVDGRTASDVAEELGMTTKAVQKAKYRVLQRLREVLADLID